MSDFEKAVKFVLEHETVFAKGHHGDYSRAVVECEPGDAGGRTKFGLDLRSHPDLADRLDTLTVEEAMLVYKREYWERSHAYELEWPLSLVQFDGAVNTGVGQQTKFLQRAVGVLDDGAWGPNTRRAVAQETADLGPLWIATHIIDARETFYHALAARNPKDARFLQGWLNRLNDLRTACNA